MATYLQRSRTIHHPNGETSKHHFGDDMVCERITITLLWVDNSRQRRKWKRLMEQEGWKDCKSVFVCWENILERLGLKATKVDECGLTVSFSVSGLRECLERLLQIVPVLNTEFRECAVPRGGKPRDYTIISAPGKDRVYAYTPDPHGRKPPKKDRIVKDGLTPFSIPRQEWASGTQDLVVTDKEADKGEQSLCWHP